MSRQIAPQSLIHGIQLDQPGISKQTNVLIIITKDKNSDSSRLLSIWLVIYPHNKSELIFLPVFPSISGKESDFAEKLAEVFYLDQAGNPANLFFDKLHEHVQWDHFVVLDHQALIKLINALGGVFINGRVQKGQQALETLETIDHDPTLLIINQSGAITSACQTIFSWNVSKIEKFIDLLVTLSAVDSGLSLQPEGWISDIKGNEPLNCEFPTLMELFH